MSGIPLTPGVPFREKFLIQKSYEKIELKIALYNQRNLCI